MDRELVVRAQHGDERAFETLTITTYPRLFRVAQGILRDATLAEDATQAAIVRIWQHLRRLRDPSKFEGRSYRLLVNACHDEAKRAPRWAPVEAGWEGEWIGFYDGAGPDDTAMVGEENAMAWASGTGDYEGWSYVANVTGTPRELTVKGLMYQNAIPPTVALGLLEAEAE